MDKKPKKHDFGRLFPDLPAFAPPTEALVELGANGGPMFDPNADSEDNPDQEPSGFTYYGQFLDHDITLDPTTLVDMPVDITTLKNFREPTFNLDSVFGGGPSVNPELYDSTDRFILTNNGRDLQRLMNGQAVLVEGRNDENMVINQLHVAFCRFYNAMRDIGYDYEEAREITVHHHQYMIINDYLPRIIPADVLEDALDNKLKIYKVSNPHDLMMPVEFSVAAFRLGHSQVRRAYFTSNRTTRIQVFNPNFPAAQDLRGGRPIPADIIINWDNFFKIPGNSNTPSNISRKLDPIISSGLFFLPPGAINSGPKELTQRNLVRGKSYGLPSGQDVAQELGQTPLTNEQIGLFDTRFNGKAPLWYYILAEARFYNNGRKLGPVGAMIVADVFIGLMRKDKGGILHGNGKKFTPIGGHGFKMGDFLKIAGVA